MFGWRDAVNLRSSPPGLRSRPVRWLSGCAMAALLLVSGCSQEFGPQARQPRAASLTDVREKIDLIKHDSCFTGNPRDKYPSCGGRYLTELHNAVQGARKEAEKTPIGDRIRPAVGAVTASINDFRSSSCDTDAGPPEQCGNALRTMNANLDRLSKELESGT